MPEIRGRAVIEFATSQSPQDFADIMAAMKDRVDAVGATVVNHRFAADTHDNAVTFHGMITGLFGHGLSCSLSPP